MGVRWALVSSPSARHGEALLAARGVKVDHATMHRWVITESPLLDKASQRRKRPVGRSWRLDETSITVQGVWRARSRAVDTEGKTIALLLTEHRDEAAAKRCVVVGAGYAIETESVRCVSPTRCGGRRCA